MGYKVQYHKNQPMPENFRRKWRTVEANSHLEAAITGLHPIIKRLDKFRINHVYAAVIPADAVFKNGLPTNTLLHCVEMSWKL